MDSRSLYVLGGPSTLSWARKLVFHNYSSQVHQDIPDVPEPGSGNGAEVAFRIERDARDNVLGVCMNETLAEKLTSLKCTQKVFPAFRSTKLENTNISARVLSLVSNNETVTSSNMPPAETRALPYRIRTNSCAQ